MKGFLDELYVRPLPDGKLWEVTEGFRYETVIDNLECIITVPKGFLTDFGSIPRAFWMVLPPWGRYGKACVVHDWLYSAKVCSRGEADRVFLEAMKELGVSHRTRTIIYSAVRMFGWIGWRRKPLGERVCVEKVKMMPLPRIEFATA